MIQRKQTLYLLSLIFMSLALLFIPSNIANYRDHAENIYLLPFESGILSASTAQIAAMLVNFISLLLSFLCIFLYKQRSLQLKLSYTLMLIWLSLTMILSFIPLFKDEVGLIIQNTNYGTLLGIFGMLGAYMAARLIKKDIELLKSADRIR